MYHVHSSYLPNPRPHIPCLKGHFFEANCNQLEFLPRRETGLHTKQHLCLQTFVSGSEWHLLIHITQQGSQLSGLAHLHAQVCLECWEGACLISTPRSGRGEYFQASELPPPEASAHPSSQGEELPAALEREDAFVASLLLWR